MYYEPQAIDDKPVPKVFTQNFLESVVKNSIANGETKPDAKLVFVAATDENGIKAIVSVNVIDRELFRVKVNGIFEYDWGGEKSAGAKVVFSM